MNRRDEKKISEYELRLLSSLLPEILKEAMIQVEKEKEQTEKDLSIPDQLRKMRDWCKAQGHHSVAMEFVNRAPLLPKTNGQYFSR